MEMSRDILASSKARKKGARKKMNELIQKGLSLYEDACGFEAEAAWSDDPETKKKSEVAWSRYDGIRTLLSMKFSIPEDMVDDDMETLMFEKTFA